MTYKAITLSDNLSIYDSSLQSICIFTSENNIINVQAIIKLNYPCNIYLKLIFRNVIEYSFYWDKDYIFYIIESYKLLRSENNLYYCSFDPADNNNTSISADDGAVVICKNIEGYYSACMDFTDSKKVEFIE